MSQGSDGKASVYNVRDLGSIPGLERFPGEGNGNPLHTLALKIPWTKELGAGYYPWGRKESGTTEQLHLELDENSSSSHFSSLEVEIQHLFPK